ncbi:hypothetical protein DICPUDRAFT_150944 [Dictyostelium purpureum]|uniref:Uncharacterized protein n=1 Tax=Dictyostelium purpureum TaxID=5786 RepID=F0ZHM6_DICPU|nr:uncharacterized protein DICPUDRAFT_150944 [Dictyostelium purpureum]EGC36541.1 hypothetical protein DICPUDRAFT_150944 [Dictyostelium purpureum]|eukprot:XP_003286913.1 hypothetical protein DICPUDRAFT_150944 [Dictyostelium purpureum]
MKNKQLLKIKENKKSNKFWLEESELDDDLEIESDSFFFPKTRSLKRKKEKSNENDNLPKFSPDKPYYEIFVDEVVTKTIYKWKVLTVPWRSTSKNHKMMFLILVYLTNLKIKKVPLRDEDYFVDETESEEEYENIPCNCDECSDSKSKGDSGSGGENKENDSE